MIYYYIIFLLGIGDWGLGDGGWGVGPKPHPHYPTPHPPLPTHNPQSPIPIFRIKIKKFLLFYSTSIYNNKLVLFNKYNSIILFQFILITPELIFSERQELFHFFILFEICAFCCISPDHIYIFWVFDKWIFICL